MYLPEHFNETREQLIFRIINEHPFGTLTTVEHNRPLVSHIPMRVEKRNRLVILGHLAKANPQLEQLDDNPDTLAVFQGPHCYVSPSWYHAPGVPTWNYVAIHLYGTSRLMNRGQTRRLVETQTRQQESSQDSPWHPDYPERMLDAIGGFEIEVNDIQCKFKLSQNRSAADRRAVIRRLADSASQMDQAVAALMALYTQENPADE